MLGYGLGLRLPHYEYVLEKRPRVDFFEVITENFLGPGGRPRHILEDIRKDYPILFHGLSMNIGSVDPINEAYLDQLVDLIKQFEPKWISDHACWTGVGGKVSHDLLPIRYSKESLNHCARRVHYIQERIQQTIVLENPTTYVTFHSSEMNEWDFLSELTKMTDCRLLLDVNNVFVNAFNLGFDPVEYIDKTPTEVVSQIHLAGHSDFGTHKIDSHDQPVCTDVWNLYAYACERFAPVATMIERDDKIGSFDELYGEMIHAQHIQRDVLKQKSAHESG